MELGLLREPLLPSKKKASFSKERKEYYRGEKTLPRRSNNSSKKRTHAGQRHRLDARRKKKDLITPRREMVGPNSWGKGRLSRTGRISSVARAEVLLSVRGKLGPVNGDQRQLCWAQLKKDTEGKRRAETEM